MPATHHAAAAMLILFLMAVPLTSPAPGQATIPIRGDRLSGFVLPIEPLEGDIEISALRVTAWEVDDTRRLLLERDVRVRIAGHSFASSRAVVWINRIPSADGLINQIAVYFEEIANPTQRAGIGVAGEDILITGSARGEVRLRAGLVEQARPPRRGIVQRGEARLAHHLRQIAAEPPQLTRRPQADRPVDPLPPRPEPSRWIDPEVVVLPDRIEVPPVEDPTPWLVSPTGVIRFAAQDIEITTGEEENVVTMIGSLFLDYEAGAAADGWDRLTLSAERAVVFTDPGPLEDFALGRMDARSVRGVYLEGSVIVRADEDRYVVRAPKAYYDFRAGQAITVDAVLRTHDRRENRLIYARADEMRQVAENQWTAQHVRVSASEFATPHFAVGARQMTITQREADEDAREAGTETHLDARGVTLRANDMPFLYWPRFSGTLQDTPLKRITFGTRDKDGVQVRTLWNLPALLGAESPVGVEADLKVDGFSKRGAGTGLDLRYRRGRHDGHLDLYGMYDDGIDRTPAGRDVDPDRDFRGVALWEHQTRFDDHWTFQGQAAYISDPTFISYWRREDFHQRREYETSAYLKHQRDNAAFTILAQHELNDFISNDYLLASRQFQVDRLPEIAYRRLGDSLFWDTMTYSSESRYSRVRLVFNETTPREIGVRAQGFGLGPDDPMDQQLRAMGLPGDYVNRLDTRHEVSMPFSLGDIRFAPFLVGRVTAWDDDFEEFSSDADKLRFFGAAGLTINTQFQRVYNNVQNRMLDLNRLRHLVEPSFTIWWGHATVSGLDLPAYDPEIESIGDGMAMRLGLRNVFQTQRGGPGRWRSEDVLTIDGALVLNSGDADRRSPIPQFFEFRPEYSQFGDHVEGSAKWMISDSLSLVGQGTYDLDESEIARGSVGAELRHTPNFSTYIEYRFINVSDLELLDLGWSYRISPKYRAQLRPQWDFRRDQFRAVDVRLTRTFPDFELIMAVRYDQISDETTVAASIGFVDF